MPSPLYQTWVSPRHGFAFDRAPTVRASKHGGSTIFHSPEVYGAILDCVYEMADDISTGNGVSPEVAVEQVLKDEGWRLIPTHRNTIISRLKTNRQA